MIKKNEIKIYWIKNNTVFSSNKSQIEIYEKLPQIDIVKEHSNFLKKNKEILEILDNLKKKEPKKIEIYGNLEDYKSIKTYLEELFKKNKSLFKKPISDDYNFIEKTSQIEILEQFLFQANQKNELEELKNKINIYCDSIENEEKEKLSQINEQITYENQKLKNLKEEYNLFKKSKIIALEQKILETEKQIENNCKKKSVLENLYQCSEDEKSSRKNLIEVERKIDKIKFQMEDNKIAIEITKAKISQINDKIKMGKKKCVNILLLILTLGFIYWTRYSDCKHIKFSLEEKASKIKEKNLLLEKKKHKLEHDLEMEKKNSQIKLIEYNKKQEEVNEKIEKLEEDNKENQKEIKLIKEKLKINSKDLEFKQEEIKKKEKSLFDIKSIKLEFEENSTKKIHDIFNKIENQINSSIEKITKLKVQLEIQKINIDGEYIYEEENS